MTPRKLKKQLGARYGRYSTIKQREASVVDQYRNCDEKAEELGIEIVASYADPKVSGGTGQRPEYRQMIADALAGKFHFIVAEDVERLWRNRKDFGHDSTALEDAGVHVITVADDCDSRRHDGWSVIADRANAGEAFRTKTSYRTRRGIKGLALAGKPTGGRAYGYVAKDKMRAINSAEAKIVVRIFKMRANGMSARAIARKLNEDGVPSPGASWNRTDDGPNRKPTDKGWRSNAIAGDWRKGTGILNNELYAGKVTFGRTVWRRAAQDSKVRRVERQPPEKWIRYDAPELRIIDEKLWNEVRAIQTRISPRGEAISNARRAVPSGAKRRGYWLSSILVCGQCGANYVAYGKQRYICSTHINGGHCDNGMAFSRDEAHQSVFKILKEQLFKPERIERERKRCEAALKQQELAARRAAGRTADTREIDEQIRQLKAMKLPASALTVALAELERERASIVDAGTGRTLEVTAEARRTVASFERFAGRYIEVLQGALVETQDAEKLASAREATRALFDGGQIALAPVAERDAVQGPVRLLGLGSRILALSGAERFARPAALLDCGSGGRI